MTARRVAKFPLFVSTAACPEVRASPQAGHLWSVELESVNSLEWRKPERMLVSSPLGGTIIVLCREMGGEAVTLGGAISRFGCSVGSGRGSRWRPKRLRVGHKI